MVCFTGRHALAPLNERQIKVLNRLLDTAGEEFREGINARKYQSLAGVSKATATRDLADLVEKSCLLQLPGGGRSTRYAVCDNGFLVRGLASRDKERQTGCYVQAEDILAKLSIRNQKTEP